MKSKIKLHLLGLLTAVILLLLPNINFGQVINLGAASNFVLYTSGGSVHDNASSHSHLTGDIGYFTSGDFLGFGNVNGVMHPGVDAKTTACNLAVLSALAQINTTTNNYFPGLLLGNGVVFTPGVYSVPGNASLNLTLVLDAQNVSSSEFIIKIDGTLATNAGAKVKLMNGAQACNVYWRVNGVVSMATNTSMKGTIITDAAAINLATGDSLEGRLICVTSGAITIDGITAFTPQGCGSPLLTGPPHPPLGSIACYALFSGNGALANTVGTSTVIGDVGNNGIGAITGWTPAAVTGALRLIQDPSTIQAAIDLSNLYDTLNALVPDIELLYPVQFGNNLTLTPHVYIMNAAAIFTDSLFLDAQGNANGVFVIKIEAGSPALVTGTYAKVKLINGAQAKNVFWLIKGAVSINNYSKFCGTIVVPSGAINLVNTGVVLEGRALTLIGAITTAGLDAAMPPGCGLLNSIIQPMNDTVCEGSTATFSVSASGTGVTYQWRKGVSDLYDGGKISGATSATLTIDNVDVTDVSMNYNVIITGSDPPIDTSNYAALFENTPPVIIQEPLDQFVCNGDTAKFTVNATGFNLSFHWRLGADELVTGGNILDATSATLVIYPVTELDAANNYNVLITGGCPPNDSSVNVNLLVNTAPNIITQPVNIAATIGGSVNFSVVATGNDLTYQWRKGNINLINTGNISGANSSILTINPVSISDTSSEYNVIVMGTCMPNDTSVYVKLIVTDAPNIIIQPTNQTICAGGSVSFSVVATGIGLTYQWRKGNVNLINSGQISGANTAMLTISPVALSDAGNDYNVIVYGLSLPNDTSVNISLIVNTAPNIITQPVNITASIGGSVNFSVVATGNDLTYQWRKGNINLINAGNISGANSSILTINPVSISDTSSEYNVIVMGSCMPNDTSVYVKLIVTDAPNIIIQPTNQTICAGGSVSFSVVATGIGLTYQWRKGNVNLINAGNISGANTATLTINPVALGDAGNNYNVIVYGLSLPNDTSVNISLIVNTAPNIITQPTNKTICAGGSESFLVVATGTNLSYQWRKGNVNLIDAGNISGVNTATLTINPVGIADTSTKYNVIVYGMCLPNDTSVNVSLMVNAAPNIITQPISQTACEGDSTGFAVVASGTGLTYQWRKGNVNLINNGHVSGVNTAILSLNPVGINDTASNYNVIVYGACLPNDTSVNVSFRVNSAPLIITEPVNQTICLGDSVSFVVVATGNGLSYQWRKGLVNLINGGNISGANNDTLTINPATFTDIANNYNVVVSGGCIAVDSATTGLTSAGSFGILSGTAITTTGFSVINDLDVGLSPGVRSSITGFPPAVVMNGAIYASDDIAPPGIAALLIQAKLDLTSAYLFAEGATAPAPATVAGDQGGKTLTPGIYKSTSTLLIQSGDLTLDAQGNANAKWIFQIASDFTTIGGAGGNVILTGGAQANNITWQVGSSATIGNYTSFKGNILALTSITMNTGSTINGRLLARNGAIVLSGANIINGPSDSTAAIVSQAVTHNVSLMVNPIPVVNSATTGTTCSGIAQNYNITSAVSGTTYHWSRATVSGISNPAIFNQTSNPITESLINTTLAPVNVIYLITPSANGCTGSTFTYTVTVNPGLPVSVLISASSNPVCQGTSVTFNATPTNGGTIPVYQWQVNGLNVGTNSTTYSYIPINNDMVTVVLTSNLGLCATDNPDTSNVVTMIVNSSLPVSVLISASSNPVCQGTSVTFNATPTNGGLNPVYQWQVNGLNVGTNSTTYSYIPLNNDVVTVVLTSNLGLCATGNPDTSNVVTMIVNPVLPVSVLIGSTANPVCQGTSVTFNATPTNGGTNPVYQWQVNGLNVGTNSATYSYIPQNNDVVTVVLTSNIGLCATNNPDTSNVVTMIVNSSLPVSVLISASSNPVCQGTSVTYNATPTNGGLNPVYQWQVNGLNVGTNNATYSYIPQNNDLITVSLTSNIGLCATNNPNTSNTVNMIVNSMLPVSVLVNATSNPVCQGTSVTFNATPTNGGTNPVYQWQVNGLNVGTNSTTYSYIPLNNDVVTVVLTSNLGLCATNNPDTSNVVTMIVNSSLPVSVLISASSNPVCQGTSVTYNATPTNGGLNPVYQWQVNGLNVGTNSATYSYIPLNNDVVTVVLTSNIGLCATDNPDTSNVVTMIVNSSLPVSVLISASSNPVCQGTSVTFNATPTNGGLNPVYQWQVNGLNVGTNSTTYSYIPLNNDVVTVVLTSNLGLCATGNPDTSNVVTMIVNPVLPVSVLINASSNPVCQGTSVTFNATPTNGGTNPVYQWQVNGINVGTNSTTYSYIPLNNDVVTVVLTSNLGPCATGNPDTSNVVTMIVRPLLPVSVLISASLNPVCQGSSVTFNATSINGGTNPVYQWQVNGINVGTNSTTYTYVPLNNDIVSVVLTSNIAPCATGNPYTSNTVIIVVNPILPVSVVITATFNPVCQGTSVTFKATPTNGGTNPAYQWKVNGINMGTNSTTYSYVPLNNDMVTCILNSNVTPCAIDNPDTSNIITMIVNPNLPVNIIIVSSINPVCSGIPVTYTATPINGGNTPVYQWKVNGLNVGINSNSYSYIPLNNDVVTCELTSNAVCSTGNPGISNTITMTVYPLAVAPIINGPTPVCINSMGNIYTVQSGNSSYTWNISAGGSITSGTTTNVVSVTWNLIGNQTISVNYTDVNGCYSSITTYNILVNICPADLTITKTVNNTHPLVGHTVIFTITATNNGPYDATGVVVTEALQSGYTFVSSSVTAGVYDVTTGLWTIGNMIDGETETLNIAAIVNSAGNYVNTTTIIGNETDTIQMNNIASVEPVPIDFFIPEGYSPNGDGINDLFVIRGIINYPENSIIIFNRWGNKVFEASPYQNNWDGNATMGVKIGSGELPIGTYFYVFNLGDGTDAYTGTIYLNR